MKALKITLFSLLGLIVLAFIAGLIIVTGIRHSGRAVYNGQMTLKGLSSEVKVYRDERGMPHIYAGNEHDLYFAVGYVMSQERLWQMDLIRRVTKGRLSEILGKNYVQTDLFLRALQMTEKSEKVLGSEDSVRLQYMQAFADGVNAYIEKAGKKLPPEFRILGYRPDPWKLEDITNIIGYMGWDLAAGNLSGELFYHKLLQKFGKEKACQLICDWKAVKSYVFPEFKLNDTLMTEAQKFIASIDKVTELGVVSFSGSNNWAVSGTRSSTGKPLLSNDMHLGLSSPGIWMQMHQVVPGKLNVTGVLVPGEPFVVAGHNERIAWGMTNLMVDDIDLFAEKVNPESKNQYFFNGEWRNMDVKDEIIKIKGGKADTIQLRFTHRGPVISGFRDIKDETLTMKWSGFDMSDEIRSVCMLNRASDWDGFCSAISSFRSVSQNFVYSDVDGNIGLHTGGGIPVRKGSGAMIRPGETDEYDWKGYVPFEQLPFSFNPADGSVSSANNITVPESYPYFISTEFIMPYRINRIREMLNAQRVFNIDDFKRMVTDEHSNYAQMLVPFILKLNDRKQDLSPIEANALATLKGWDQDMNPGLAAPTVFEFFRESLAKDLLADELTDIYKDAPGTVKDYYIYRVITEGPDDWVDNITTPQKETLDDIMLKSLKDCSASIVSKYGADTTNWKWGSVHKIILEHPLGSVKLLDKLFHFNSKAYNAGGSNHTVCPYSYGEGFKVNDGASERHIFNTADWDESYTVIPTGESGVPGSEFYLSQTNTYIGGKFFKDHFSEDAVRKSVKYTLILAPGQ
jgi:penicillin amidase